MYVRLAFAVAAHLEPEILIVDEVLAVGDAEFQKKCLGKMKDVSVNQGRTVLFVSHQMDTIKQLADRTILVNNGTLAINGSSDMAIAYHLNDFKNQIKAYEFKKNARDPYFEDIKVYTSQSSGIHVFGKLLKIGIIINLPDGVDALETSFQIFSQEDQSAIVYNWFSSSDTLKDLKHKAGRFLVKIELPNLQLYKGEYYFKFHLSDPRGKVVFESIDFIYPFEVIMGELYNEWGFRNGLCKFLAHYELKVSEL